MEVSALRYSGGIRLHARSPLLRLQSDERLVALIRRGSTTAFEVLVSRYHARLLAFCRHLLGSREDAEDVLQEVFSAAFNAILDDDRPINVRPWLYRIARNRSLNHLRRIQAVGVDSMDIHLFEHGATTADKVHEREEFRMLVDDIQALPETQRTALVLREMDALSYEQIAEAMETTVPSVKSLLVRARVSLAEAAQARMLTCEEVRIELGEVAEGLRRRPGPLVRRHLRACERCSTFKGQLSDTSKALAALLPIGFAPLALLRKLAIVHIGHSGRRRLERVGRGAAARRRQSEVTAAAGATAVMGTSTTAASCRPAWARSPPRRPPAWPPRRWSRPAPSRSSSRRARMSTTTPPDPRSRRPPFPARRRTIAARRPAGAGRRAPPRAGVASERGQASAQTGSGQGHRHHPAQAAAARQARRPPATTKAKTKPNGARRAAPRPRPTPPC